MEDAKSLSQGINSLIDKLQKVNPKSFLFEYCPLSEIIKEKSLTILLNSQWMHFAVQFQETELMLDCIERDFNRPGM